MQEYADDIYDGADMGVWKDKRRCAPCCRFKVQRVLYVHKGYGITVFTDAGIQYVGQQMRPELADGDFAGAFAHLPHCV